MLIIIIICIRFMLPPCILNLTSFTACVLSLQACSEAWSTTFRETRLAYFEFDWQPFSLARAIWSYGTFAAFTCFGSSSEHCWNSNCSYVSLLCSDTLLNFSASLSRNGNVVVQRRTSSLSVSCRPERCCSSSNTFSLSLIHIWRCRRRG